MASLDFAMLSPAHQPIPLPQEKFLLTLPAISLSLFPCPPGAALTVSPPKDGSHLQAQGKLYASNQRVVFVASEEKAGKQGALKSLSVPYSHFQDGRFKQPIFSAAYYEALCLPADGGGLSGPHICRFSFREAGGYQFYETVEEMKNRLGASGRGTPVEALPLYTPSTSASSAPADPSPLGTSTSPPNEDDLAAAAVARSAQEEEEDAAMAASTGDVRPPSVGPGGAQAARSAEGEPRDGPPGYEP